MTPPPRIGQMNGLSIALPTRGAIRDFVAFNIVVAVILIELHRTLCIDLVFEIPDALQGFHVSAVKLIDFARKVDDFPIEIRVIDLANEPNYFFGVADDTHDKSLANGRYEIRRFRPEPVLPPQAFTGATIVVKC